MTEITEHDKFYWQYEYDVVAKYLVPLLRGWGVEPKGATLLDVGCGDGGGLAALYDAGMNCKGYDIEQRRVDLALGMNGDRTMDLRVGNIYLNPAPFSGERFDLVVLHDVFEHLDHKEDVLKTLRSYLNPSGKLMITFPPYFSAYGGHQQLMRTWFARLPFVHLLPFMVSNVFPGLSNENPSFVEEIQKLARLKMGMKKFEKLPAAAGLKIEAKQGYFISPNHIRFGLNPVPNNLLAEVPLLGEIVTSGAIYLLSGA
jgi:2-polyprenyl-3-methyl-5-hydroxy-6-metoxy-1,4-benzoquinol methylase